jgi:uncharacterized repeat protein (TIGR03803 family)
MASLKRWTFSLVLLLAVSGAVGAHAQMYTESILYSFTESQLDNGSLVRDSAGNLYGTSYFGGLKSTVCSYGCGTVFELSTQGVLSTLHTFTDGADGSYPCCLAIDGSGNLYGTTLYGGKGYGTIFEFSAAKKFSTLHEFGTSSTDGLSPAGPLTIDPEGNLYGMTLSGGTSLECGNNSRSGCGTMFKISSIGKESILYNFTPESGTPVYSGNVLRNDKDNLYGVGGSGDILFELIGGIESVLTSGLIQDGANALTGEVVRDGNGNFYGSFNDAGGSGNSGIWAFNIKSGTTSFYEFCDGGCDVSLVGSGLSGPLLFSGGNLYGTAHYGGRFVGVVNYGGGTVYALDPTTGIANAVYSFPNPTSLPATDGWTPFGGVIADPEGNLYGTTNGGGTYGYGTIFKLTKN